MIASRHVGRTRLVRANLSLPWAQDLVALIAKTVGVSAILARALQGVAGVDEAYVFGSWAARFHGVTGARARDIDVVVVGDADFDDVRDACDSSRRR